MRPAPEWFRKTRERVLKFWHTENPKMAIVRDVAAAGGVVLVLLAAIWIYAGQPLSQAPVVSVESGSMMHGPFRGGKESQPTGWDSPAFGRLGTIDPGDIVFVKDIDSWEDVEVAFGPGGRDGYGGHGDVIVFKPDGSGSKTRVIHRAMLYIEVDRPGCSPRLNECSYRIPAACDGNLNQYAGTDLTRFCQFTKDRPSFTLNRDGLFVRLDNFPCWSQQGDCPDVLYSGFITKGDNNEAIDQDPNVRISAPVRVEWIIGKARGEIPWFGLIKLALYGNPSYQGGLSDPTKGDNWKILEATAPWDIWLSLFISLGVLVAIPMVLDFVGNLRSKRGRKDAKAPQPPPEDELTPKPPQGPT